MVDTLSSCKTTSNWFFCDLCKHVVKDLKDNVNSMKFEIFNNNGLCADSKESFLIALMGYARYNNIPNNMQTVTGAKSLCSYGEIYE